MEKTIIIKSYSNRIDAEIGKGKLDANGIKSFIQADDVGGMEGYLLNATGFVKLCVLKKDYIAAKKLLF